MIDIEQRFERLMEDFERAVARAGRGLPFRDETNVRFCAGVSVAGRYVANVKPELPRKSICRFCWPTCKNAWPATTLPPLPQSWRRA